MNRKTAEIKSVPC